VTGLVVKEDDKQVEIFDGQKLRAFKKDDIDARTPLKQSSMPEGLAGTMAPVEFLDLVTFLKSLK
jgi:hypothetical protein